MSILVVEDGLGLNPLANTYVSLAEFSTYWTERGFDYTTYSVGALERSLILATDYIDLVNGKWFKGYPLEEDQALAFPRSYLYVNCILVEGIPDDLKRATFQYAKRVLVLAGLDLLPDPNDRDDSGGIVIKSFKKIGPIETDVTFLPGSAADVRSYPTADRYLQCYLRTWGGSIRN